MALSLATLGGVSAYGQDVEGVVVKGSRMVTENIGRSPSGVPISEISLSYKVSYADLDLTSNEGKVALEKRVSDAARAACKEISRLHPGAKPDDVDCAKAAVDEAMIRVREAIATAKK
jgi:UrcA family protein